MIKAIFTDLDDTLLRSDKTISPYMMEILQKCREKGILVGFCTARGESCTRYFLDQAHPDISITSGGALAKYQNETIYEVPISAEETRTLLEAGKSLAGDQCIMAVDTRDGYFRNDDRKRTIDWGVIWHTDFEGFAEETMRLTISLPNAEAAAELAGKVKDCNFLNFLNSNWYRIAKNGAEKEIAIQKIGEFLHILPEEMIAFGDDYGDIGMLKFCGIGCAMENALPDVKKAADVVIGSNNEDGVAHYLETYVLNML